MFDVVSSWVMHLSLVILFAYNADVTLQRDQAIWFNFVFLKRPIKISVGTVYSVSSSPGMGMVVSISCPTHSLLPHHSVLHSELWKATLNKSSRNEYNK